MHSKELGVERRGHSAFDDANILVTVGNKKNKISLLVHVVIHLKILCTT